MKSKNTEAKELTHEEALAQLAEKDTVIAERDTVIEEQNKLIEDLERKVAALNKGEKIYAQVEVDGKTYQILNDNFVFQVRANLKADKKNRYDKLIEQGIITEEIARQFGTPKTVSSAELAENPDLVRVLIALNSTVIKLLK